MAISGIRLATNGAAVPGTTALIMAERRYEEACQRVGVATVALRQALEGVALGSAPSVAAVDAAARRVVGTVNVARSAGHALMQLRRRMNWRGRLAAEVREIVVAARSL